MLWQRASPVHLGNIGQDVCKQVHASALFKSSLRCLAAGLLTLSAGCATIVHGRHQAIYVTSDPPGAHAAANGTSITTPGVMHLVRSRGHVVRVSKPGYYDVERRIDQKVSPWVFVDAVLGGIFLGPLGDYSLGGLYNLIPDQVGVVLDKKIEGESE